MLSKGRHQTATGPYFTRVCTSTFNRYSLGQNRYRSFGGLRDEFLSNPKRYQVASVRASRLRFEDVAQDTKFSLFVRDPRDLIVSGYHYHKKGAEKWCHEKRPKGSDFDSFGDAPVKDTPSGESYYDHLNRVSVEDGLIAEIKFRKRSFEAQRHWARIQSDRLLLLKYEDILGREVEAFRRLASYYELSLIDTQKFLFFAKRNSAPRKVSQGGHIRNPSPSQWRSIFSPKVEAFFDEHQGETMDVLGYA
jgi:hypothetical protein